MVLHKKKGSTKDQYCIDQYEYPGYRQLPQVNVSFEEAQSLCEERGKRLCTAQEWTHSCRKGRVGYPYGSRFNARRCNTKGLNGEERILERSGVFKRCKTPKGVYDLSGNVGEWVLDQRVYGGHYRSSSDESGCLHSQSYAALATQPYVGFRCCMDL